MTDRELLELAAKAAGIEASGRDDDGTLHVSTSARWQATGEAVVKLWNPLRSNADAFRLQVALFMKVKVQRLGTPWVEVAAFIGFDPARHPRTINFKRVQRLDGDAAAVVRRCIVTVAADIGRNL